MEYIGKTYDEERALYGISDALVKDCRFDGPADGESAMKESGGLTVENCFFNLRYPFWHVKDTVIRGCEMTDKCRAALWYDENVKIADSALHGIKALRECRGVTLRDCGVISPEFLWKCSGVSVSGGSIESEYPFFECSDVDIDGLKMKGKYSFQYTENVNIKNAVFDTKDAFWHSKNVTVTDSVVRGEYLGWYSENLHLVRCHIIGTQPLCYCRGLILEDCTTENCDLAFERSEVKAVISGHIDSVKNPLCGEITAGSIGEVILENEFIDPSRTAIMIK